MLELAIVSHEDSFLINQINTPQANPQLLMSSLHNLNNEIIPDWFDRKVHHLLTPRQKEKLARLLEAFIDPYRRGVPPWIS